MQFLLESSFEAINSGLDKISQVSKIGNSPNASTFQGKFGDIVPYTMETCYNSDFSCVFFSVVTLRCVSEYNCSQKMKHLSSRPQTQGIK